jgi:hypothetical protein
LLAKYPWFILSPMRLSTVTVTVTVTVTAMQVFLMVGLFIFRTNRTTSMRPFSLKDVLAYHASGFALQSL